jgi:pantoate--beta-alanine ligase
MSLLCREVETLGATLAAWRAAGQSIALVPTMGALHAGHLSLVAAARTKADRVVVTIFVNPRQFAPNEDFAAYPRDLETDLAAVASAGADLVYAPDVASMYPPHFATSVEVGGPAKAGLEDRFRPTHFAGVATVVTKLLRRVAPDLAIFGEKDFQQLAVIRRFTTDLDLDVTILGAPIVREADGLALSSRNVYLDEGERRNAPRLYAALMRCARAIEAGTPVAEAVAAALDELAEAGFVTDYVDLRRADDLAPWDGRTPAAGRLLAAARLGRTRLIDNVPVDLQPTLRLRENA